ncbi:Alpha/Beta hydrolase protein [Phakopsora pachyrhizi]|uniref:Alpha/Beta hydrolase protein n=1 Tax=Phakopsora pachyrhizi TaxID=170000 RepID=A0AAV0B0D0_PHAPC|nr:Alpha/Beta hydrolase protein [Phakopsora pachyrhizi]CAH7674125.1 Alpha/Beta hydrolase protein [Phakopsora pachyrhizi]
MPFVEVSPGISLYYDIGRCESETRPASEMPWLLTLHPLYQDCYYTKRNTEDKTIKSHFNRINFDFRYHGRSKNPVVAAFDVYTLAADIAIGLDKLKIPPVHALALHPWSSEILIRMSIIFSEKLLSLCLCSISPREDDDFNKRAFGECFQCWAYPEVPEDWDEAISSVQWWHFGPASHFDADVLDEWAGIMLRRFPPSNAVEQVVVAMPYLKRDALPNSAHENIKQPALFLRGGLDTVYTITDTNDRLNALPPNPFHELKVIPGAPLQFCRTHPDELRDNYLDWVLPIIEQLKEKAPRYRRIHWQGCLDRLSHLAGDDSVSTRDPTKSSSYYKLNSQTVQETTALLEQLKERQHTAFSFVGGNAPETWTGADFDEVFPWRFSSRFDDARMAGSSSSRNNSLPMHEVVETLVEVSYEDEEDEGEGDRVGLETETEG